MLRVVVLRVLSFDDEVAPFSVADLYCLKLFYVKLSRSIITIPAS